MGQRSCLLAVAVLSLRNAVGFTPLLTTTRLTTLAGPRSVTAFSPPTARVRQVGAWVMNSEPSMSGTAIISGFFDDKDRTDDMPFDVVHRHGEPSRPLSAAPVTPRQPP